MAEQASGADQCTLFLALLEMARNRKILLRQDEPDLPLYLKSA
jgi:chromatin segregation and condensation protein Rec8/ScpA/Scc1 (kleisin family)